MIYRKRIDMVVDFILISVGIYFGFFIPFYSFLVTKLYIIGIYFSVVFFVATFYMFSKKKVIFLDKTTLKPFLIGSYIGIFIMLIYWMMF